VGVGVEIPFDRLFIDLDLSAKGFIEINRDSPSYKDGNHGWYASMRLLGGVKIFEKLSLFGGFLLDMFPGFQESVSDVHDGYSWALGRNDHETIFYPQWTVGLQF